MLKSHRVVRPYFGNVISVVEDLPMVRGPWDCENRAKL